MSGAPVRTRGRRGSARHSLRVAAALARTSSQQELQYRSNAWATCVGTLTELAVSLTSLWIVLRSVHEVDGWRTSDLLMLLGSYFLLSAIVNGVVHSSVSELVSQVRLGTFDFRLLKPVDSQVVAAVQQVNPWRFADGLAGLGLVIAGIVKAGGIDPLRVPEAFGMFFAAVAIVTGFWLLVASVVFWTVQGDDVLYALDDTYDSLKWPIAIFPPGLRIALSTVFPAGFAITVPAQALTGRLSWTIALVGIALGAGFIAAARVTWIAGIRHYEGASS